MRHLRERPTVMKRWVDGVAGRAVLPEARPRQRARLAADGDRHLPQRPPRARARAQRRRPPRLGRQPRRDRLEPLAGAPRPTSTTPTSCASTSTPARASRSTRSARSRSACARCSTSTGCAASPRPPARAASTSTCASQPEQSFEEVRRAALALAREVERRMPGRATSRWWKEEREGVFIDYNQNARDRTVASAYSVRAVPDARVSCPLEWDEVADVEPAELTLKTVPARLRERGDPSASIDEHPGSLDGAARAGRPRRARRPRRRALAAALPQAEERAAARAAEPRARAHGRQARAARERRAREPAAEPPLKPQLALSRKELPTGDDYRYEIKLDGFRCLAFVDGEEVFLQSRNGKPLGPLLPRADLPRRPLRARRRDRRPRRHGPRGLRRARPAHPPGRLADRAPGRRDARRLRRLRPARPRRRARCWSCPSTSAARRSRSCSRDEAFRAGARRADADRRHRRRGRSRGSSSAEGAIAKERSAPYRPGERKGMVKVKRVRTIDAVVVGWRPGKEAGTVGALILGLYDGAELRVVGHCSGLTAAEKRRLVGFLAPYESGERGSADPSRWSAGQGARVDRAAPRAGRRDRLRPRLRRAHPPRRQAAPLARGQGPARVHLRAAAGLSGPLASAA